ncbi:Uncharacterized protein FWK35_00038997 [Aphis craccivora]|uniref:Secreted protein n=1 Tax=Aphis craccivora TaxID=307492 RepID=A0A6G0Z4K2_APHCR|nr:Uncharacterized protein FWK35_00038997 [Aphis craccivora]
MLCVLFIFFFFCVCLCTRECVEIFNFSSFSGSKVNLVVVFRRSFFENPNTFQKHQEKSKKN